MEQAWEGHVGAAEDCLLLSVCHSVSGGMFSLFKGGQDSYIRRTAHSGPGRKQSAPKFSLESDNGMPPAASRAFMCPIASIISIVFLFAALLEDSKWHQNCENIAQENCV